MENSSRLSSQIFGSTCSPSLPSEPPDIGNWFSSYGYESPVLGTITGFGDCVSIESEGFVVRESTKEIEKKSDEIGKSICKDELDFVIENTNSNVFANKHETQSSSEIPDSSYSPPGVSEPPDIRNWLSSYVYESFVLDTNDDVNDSVSHESECEKEEEANAGTFGESRSCDEMGVGQGICSNGSFDKKSLCKISDFVDSPSLFTEPPDVKNWLSNYVYESPVLDTSDEFGDFLNLERDPKEGKKEEKLEIIKQVRSVNEEIGVENVHSSGNLEHISSFGVNKQVKESINKDIERIERKEITSSQNNMCSVKSFKESLEGRTLQSNGMSPYKDAKELSFNDGGSMSKPMQGFSQEVGSVLLHVNTSSGNHKKKSPATLFHEKHDKENERKGNPKENGFVATRKKGCARTGNEDAEERLEAILLERTKENDGIKRKLLTETTNFQHSDVIGVTGKWRCPQKSKPNRGPPLKQLRLERWIHKV
ncbi:hypothetical protein ACOSP7_027029 [Xanthoceras sorbifolium]